MIRAFILWSLFLGFQITFWFTVSQSPVAAEDFQKSSPTHVEDFSELEHLGPASPKLIDQVLEEVAPDSVESFVNGKGSTLNEKTSSQNLLKDFSITLDRIGKIIRGVPKAPTITTCLISGVAPVPDWKYYPVTQLEGKNIVAVIATSPQMASILNPIQGFNYGPIPYIPNLTSQQAEILWGTPYSETKLGPRETNREYRLVSTNHKNVKRHFTIDCLFRNDCLFRYRISGPGIDKVELGPLFYR